MVTPHEEVYSIAPCFYETLPDVDLSNEEMGDCQAPIPTAVIDWDHLHQLSDGNLEFELELLHLFVEDSWDHVAQLKQLVQTLHSAGGRNQSDFGQAERVAHYLMGASANVGAWKVRQAADLLEQQFRKYSLEQVSQLVVALEASLSQINELV